MVNESGTCPFCALPPSRIVLASELAVALFNAYPVSKGHALVIPRRHAKSARDLSDPEMLEIWRLLHQSVVAVAG
jgi:diadenosine tetraphosphate (Ap4A) HIT family hydrolase